MYDYVGKKEDILHLIGRTLVNTIDQPFLEFANGLGEMSSQLALRICWQYYVKRIEEERSLIIVMNRETNLFDVNDREDLLNKDPLAMRVFEKVLIEGVQSGEFACNNTKLMAFNIWVKAHEWALKGWLLKRYVTIEQYIETQYEDFTKLLVLKVVVNN